MKDFVGISPVVGSLGNQKGSAAYTFMGLAIIAVVIIVAIFFFPWGQVLKDKQNEDLIAANEAMAKNQWDKALTFFDKSIKSNPKDPVAYIGRSRAYLNLGNLQKAMEDAGKAVEKKADSAQAYGQRGIVLKVMKKNDESLKDFSQAIKLDPAYSWAFAQRADIYSRLQDQEKALQDATRALQSKPNFVEAYRLRAWILSRMGKCREASEDFKKIETLKPNDASFLQDKAWFLLTCPDESLQDSNKAMELAKKAMELTEGKDGIVQETLAEAYFRQGDAQKAVEHQRKAIELGSKNCPDGSCVKEMQDRLQKYEMATRQEVRNAYEILPMDSNY
ncbi:MAG: tetratricopeptide repeat protein [Desulfomonile sp.]|jgi:tetratricopeptide (TPR) repeat protein